MIFTLSADNAINGTQLVAEILEILGLEVQYGFIPPRTVEILGVEGFEDEVQAIIDAHVPVLGGSQLLPIDFANRFTVSEHAAILASTDPVVRVFHDKLHLAPYVDKESAVVIAGLDYYVSVGLLASHRPAEILA